MSDSWNEVEPRPDHDRRHLLANEKYFGDLDSVVGDGDFGYSLARGFEKLKALSTASWTGPDIGTF